MGFISWIISIVVGLFIAVMLFTLPEFFIGIHDIISNSPLFNFGHIFVLAIIAIMILINVMNIFSKNTKEIHK